MPNIAPAYQASKGSPLDVDRAFYQRIVQEQGARKLVEKLVVPIRSGRAWRVPAGHVFRIVSIDGPQVGDLNIWNYNNPRERMWASRSRQLQAVHVSTFDRLWSNLPFLRPLVTITDDSLAGYGVDEFGGRVHDLLGTRCDPYMNSHADGGGFPLPLPLQPGARGDAVWADRVRRARRAERVPGDRAELRRSVFHAGKSGEAWRSSGVLRRDRSAVCDLGVSGRRPVGAAMGAGRARSLGSLPAVGRRGLRAGSAIADGLDLAPGGRVSRRARAARRAGRVGRNSGRYLS